MPTGELRRWTREEYEKMIDTGILRPDDHVELVEGEIFSMTPQKSLHATAIRLLEDVLREVFGAAHDVRTQLPVALTPLSEPEPDVAVVSGAPRDYRDAHPQSALLIVEVADATLENDRKRKGSLYARVGVADYWILNVLEQTLEVYREPGPAENAAYGFDYRSVVFPERDSVSPLAAPLSTVAVADLIP
ncbi:MAG: Uma2 family endonuclease [Acidobacteriota bacterium]